MNARDFLEFDGKPGISGTDILSFVVVLAMLSVIVATLALVVVHTAEGADDPAGPACAQAIADGYYTDELMGQCLDDFRDSLVTP